MTSRLKRKLGDLGVDTSSRKANENFCLIGTPLPPLEKSKDTGEFVPLWKQEVRDEKGRRRLHGAFTGGFSAGYFNTVGSKEGWTPQTFVSSRNDRVKKQAARPEDFMDDEDLQDLKDSRNLVDTTEEMDFMGGTQAELLVKAEVDDSDRDPISRTLEASLLPAPKDSVGAKILKKMGWRLGQGIGPRVSLKRRKEQDSQAYDATSGTRLITGKLDLPDDDDEATKHTYAPRDTPVLAVRRKDNTHGLGYMPGMSLNDSVNGAGCSQGPQLSGGFGLGALNDADEDDLDVYDHIQNHTRRRVAYDNLDGDDDDTVLIGGKLDKRKLPSTKSLQSSSQHFRDGRPVLAGFVLSDEPVAEDKWFPLPEIPSGWKPDPSRVWASNKENAPAPPPSQPADQTHAAWKRSKISADQRGSLLGETPLPSGPRSVFDYMSEKDKERIKNIASGLAAGSLLSSSTSGPSHPPPPQASNAKLEPHIAQAALRGFQPFTTDPVKQARYTAYLQSQADSDSPSLKPNQNQRSDDFNKELEDYAKAASLFKPMSGAMAGRFTSAAVIDMGPKVVEGLHTPTTAELEEKEAQRQKEEDEKISPKAHAAKMGMFGPMTRETKPWAPARLLCKRFGVKEPTIAAEVPEDGASATAGASGQDSSFSQPDFSGATPSATKDITVPIQRSDGPRDLNNIGFGEDETQGQDTLTYQRPSMDIFKAIFASDDEDDEDDDEKAEAEDEGTTSATANEMKDLQRGFTKATAILDDTPVDPNTFKPTFIPREGKARKTKEEDKSRDKKEKKKKKDKEKKGVLVSFEMDEDASTVAEPKQPKDRPPKKKKRKEEKERPEDSEEHGMWVDQAPSVVVPVAGDPSSGGTKGRKRAVDFMD